MRENRAKTQVRWYRSPLSAADLARLNRRSDAQGLAHALGHLALLACSGALAWHAASHAHPLLALALVYLHGSLWAFLVNGFHELCHKTVFKTAALNIFFRNLYAFLGWYNHVSFWASHQAHHRYTLHPPDDLEVVLPSKLTLRSYLGFAFVNPRGLWLRLKGVVLLSTGRIADDWERALFPPEALEQRRALFNWARILLLGHGLLLAVSLWQGWWLLPILVTLAPFYGGGFQFLLNETQHIGLTDEVSDYRLNTRTFLVNPLLRHLYWHMNFHIEHHMYAAVPCYNLAALHELVRDDTPRPTRGLLETWRQIAGILRRQRIEPGYQFAPELP